MGPYMRSKVRESWAKAWSTMGLMRRMGWRCGTRASGATAVVMVACLADLSRMGGAPLPKMAQSYRQSVAPQ